MDFIPLVMPTPPSTSPNFAATSLYLQRSANAIAKSAASFMDSLSELKSIDFSQVGNLPDFRSVVWLGSMQDAMVRPTRPTVDTSIADLLAQLNALVAPTAPSNTFAYTDTGYTSALRQPLIEKLLNDILNGSYGIDVNDELALWSRMRDRAALAMQSNIDEVKRQAASTSFPMPQGAMYTAIERARQEMAAKMSDTNREVALERSRLYNETRKFTITEALSSESQSIELYNSIQNRGLLIARTTSEIAIRVYEAGILYFTTQLQAVLKQIDAKLEGARATVQIYAADVSAYAAFVNAVASAAQVQVANSRNVMTRDIAAHQAIVDQVRFKLEQLKTTVANSVDINKNGAEFFRTGLGASLAGISGLAVQTTTV